MVYACLRANIGVVISDEDRCGGGRDLDDRRRIRHDAYQYLHELVGALKLQVHHHVEIFFAGFFKLREKADTSGIDRNIDLAVGIHDGLH